MKENILQTALSLFNELGVSNITLRNIAENLKISDGHLRYYFRTKEDLLLALFEEVDKKISSLIPPDVQLLSKASIVITGLESLSDLIFDYKFFFVESLEIYSRYPKVAEKYIQMMLIRKNQMKGIYAVFVQNGIFRDSLSDSEIQILYETAFILSDNYHRFAFFDSHPNKPEKLSLKRNFSVVLLSLYLPYCQEESRKTFTDYIQNQPLN